MTLQNPASNYHIHPETGENLKEYQGGTINGEGGGNFELHPIQLHSVGIKANEFNALPTQDKYDIHSMTGEGDHHLSSDIKDKFNAFHGGKVDIDTFKTLPLSQKVSLSRQSYWSESHPRKALQWAPDVNKSEQLELIKDLLKKALKEHFPDLIK